MSPESGRTSTLSEQPDHVANESDVAKTCARNKAEEVDRKPLYEYISASDCEDVIATSTEETYDKSACSISAYPYDDAEPQIDNYTKSGTTTMSI